MLNVSSEYSFKGNAQFIKKVTFETLTDFKQNQATSKIWTKTLGLDARPEPRIIWTQENLDPEKPGPRKAWTLKNLDHEKGRKQLNAEKRLKD